MNTKDIATIVEGRPTGTCHGCKTEMWVGHLMPTGVGSFCRECDSLYVPRLTRGILEPTALHRTYCRKSQRPRSKTPRGNGDADSHREGEADRQSVFCEAG
jgi:hypothetical protein